MRDQHGARSFFLADPLFGLRADWVRAFCDALARRAPDVRWSCMTRPDLVDLALLRAMAAAGCTNVLFGVESLSTAVQSACGKRLDPERVAPAVAAARAAGLESVVSLMVGLPGDDAAGFRRSVEAITAMEPDFLQFFVVRVGKDPQLPAGRTLGDPGGGRYDFPGVAFAGDGFRDAAELERLHRWAWARFYLRPRYARRRLLRAARAPRPWAEASRLVRGARLAARLSLTGR